MKLCPKCDRTLPINSFYKKTASRRQSYCKDCFNAYCVERWIRRKKDFVRRMGEACVDCSTTFHYAVFEFHHVGGKDFDWTRLRLRPDKDIEKELEKCVLLCANCHRLRHVEDRS